MEMLGRNQEGQAHGEKMWVAGELNSMQDKYLGVNLV